MTTRRPSAPAHVREIARRLASAGHETWAVGGAVRDVLMGRPLGDWDLATSARPREMRRIFRRTVPLGMEHGTVGVLVPDGTMYEVIEFAMEYDFVNGLRARTGDNSNFFDSNVTAITDLWLQVSHTPIGNIRVGNQKEPMGFEHIVSSRFLPFMERSYNQDTFYGGSFNGFTPGIALWSNVLEDRASYNIGLYKPANNVFAFNNNDGDYAVTGRLTWLPIYAVIYWAPRV